MLPIHSDFIESIKHATFADPDVLSSLPPQEGLWLGVGLQQVVVDRAFKSADAGQGATSNVLCRDLSEEAFDEVQPARAGGRDVRLETRLFLQPCPHLLHLMGCVVV